MFRHRKATSSVLALIAAVMLTACGSGDSTPSDTSENVAGLHYTGITDPALLDAANAKALSTKALGIGFLDGSDAELAPLNKSIELLAGPLAPKPGTTPVMGMIELLGRHGEDILRAFSPIVEGPIVPNVSARSVFFQPGFPNQGGTFFHDLAETQTETTVRYSGTLTFADAAHCNRTDAGTCTDKQILSGAVSLTVEFLKNDMPSDMDANLPAFDKLSTLLNRNISPVIKTVTTAGLFTTTREGLSDGFGEVNNGEFSGYSTSRTMTYAMEGEASWTQETTGLNKAFGEKPNTATLHFTGSLKIDESTDSADGKILLDFDATNATVTFNQKTGAESPASAQDGERFETTNGSLMDLAFSGDATLTFTAQTKADTLTLQAALAGGRFGLTAKGGRTEQRLAVDDVSSPGEIDFDSETRLISTLNTYTKIRIDFAGAVDLNATYTTTLVSAVTQTLGMKLNAGKAIFDLNMQELTEYALDANNVPVTPSTVTRTTNTTSSALSIDGDLALTNGIEPITLVGDLDFVMSHESKEDRLYPELSDTTATGTLTLKELSIKTGHIDTTIQGTIDFDVDFAGNEMDRMVKVARQDATLNLNMELLLSNNLEGKTYRFNDYKVGILLGAIDHDEIDAEGPTFSVSGRFYHPDHGYVDINTGRTPFFINRYALERSLEMGDTDLLLASLFPLAGEMTITGGTGSHAVLKAQSTYSSKLDENIPGGYTLSVDADGNGTYETATFHAWPDLSQTTDRIWVFRLGLDLMGWLTKIGPRG